MRSCTRTLKCGLLGFLVLTVAVTYLVHHGPAPNYRLLYRIEKLEAQNSKLHEDIQALSSLQDRGGATPQAWPHQERRPNPAGEGEGGMKEEICEVVHLALVVSGSATVRRLMVVVKSILFHRRNPIHLHFLSDTKTEQSLAMIFQTWQLPAVNVSFYSLAKAIGMVDWIPNTHYSGVFGLAKLTLVDILPSSLHAVIVLDTDLLLTADIGELWKFVKRLQRDEKQLGLVENQSDWYLGTMWKGHKPWPAVGRGFNTGVALLNLELMRMKNWNGTWQSSARDSLVTHSRTALADQDVINAAIKRDRGLVFILPCMWNVQLGENTLSDYCFKSAHDFKIIHWNSAAKLEVRNVYGPHFKNLFSMFEDYDSMLFRTHLSGCDSISRLGPVSSEFEKREGSSDPCSDVRHESQLVHRVHPHYLNFSYQSEDGNDVTLVAQMSMDRLHMLGPLCEQWGGPLSIALYASDADLRELTNHVAALPVLRDSEKLALHVVSKSGNHYPVNHLRNVALEHAQTPYVYLSDIDFLPMHGLYYYIREAVRVLGENKRALIVPAFESLLYQVDFPRNKTQVLSMLLEGKLFTFRYHVWRQGHSQTNFEHWGRTRRPYKVEWMQDFEPYYVVSRNVTRYDERFVGFGWNKVSHAMSLAAQGYELVVLPEAFMVHMPHAPSSDIRSYRHSKHYRDCMQVLKREFKKELQLKYSWHYD